MCGTPKFDRVRDSRAFATIFMNPANILYRKAEDVDMPLKNALNAKSTKISAEEAEDLLWEVKVKYRW